MNKTAIKFTLALICVAQATSMNGMEKFVMSLPINATLAKGKRSHLIVETPENFKSLNDPKNLFVEFVPINENETNWSKIITTDVRLNQQVTAEEMITIIKKGIKEADPVAEVIVQSSDKGEGYESKKLLMAYLFKGREELLLVNYFSGPYDCVGFQYTIALINGIGKDAAQAELEKFEKEKTKVINL